MPLVLRAPWPRALPPPPLIHLVARRCTCRGRLRDARSDRVAHIGLESGDRVGPVQHSPAQVAVSGHVRIVEDLSERAAATVLADDVAAELRLSERPTAEEPERPSLYSAAAEATDLASQSNFF
jgi:hypothetical protein